eukprot:287337-Chlamydomonas_euryale.AAC.5
MAGLYAAALHTGTRPSGPQPPATAVHAWMQCASTAVPAWTQCASTAVPAWTRDHASHSRGPAPGRMRACHTARRNAQQRAARAGRGSSTATSRGALSAGCARCSVLVAPVAQYWLRRLLSTGCARCPCRLPSGLAAGSAPARA